jgi:hypothetical protein
MREGLKDASEYNENAKSGKNEVQAARMESEQSLVIDTGDK